MPLKEVRADEKEAPKAIGPYSQAIKAGHYVFVSGQIPLDPLTGLLDSGEIRGQTFRVLQNLEAVLKAAGCGLNNVVKTTIYLTDLSNFGVVNDIYGFRFAADPKPARATVQVAALPKSALIEMDCVAYLGD
ncbi:MAG: RidA family protein [Candidatus Pacearchaeota archaeon]|nr:RidA family protein [Candidatus Pacearchaeota archaeon]